MHVSVIVPVAERSQHAAELYGEYVEAIRRTGVNYDFTYVLDGAFVDTFAALKSLKDAGEPLQIVQLAKSFGESTALTAGFEATSGDVILTLPAYYQVEPNELSKVLEAMAGADMVVGRRWPRVDSTFNRYQTALFSWIVRRLTDSPGRDLGCGVRAFRRELAEEVPIYGDQHRFMALLASRQGYRVVEVDLKQSGRDDYRRVYRLGIYPRRLLDLLSVYFLIKFTKKPLRFFGLVGAAVFALGALATLFLLVQRLFFDMPLAERPALLLGVLLVVLGVQLFALGLVGELIIFTRARDIKEYRIDRIIN